MNTKSRHRFTPDPLHPTECAFCGRRADAHETPVPETLVGWQRRLCS